MCRGLAHLAHFQTLSLHSLTATCHPCGGPPAEVIPDGAVIPSATCRGRVQPCRGSGPAAGAQWQWLVKELLFSYSDGPPPHTHNPTPQQR